MPRIIKTVGFFNHLPHISEGEADRHYLGAHVPFIAGMMHATGIAHSYYTAKVVAQQDINGTWLQRPDDWRSVAIRVVVPEDGGAMDERIRSAIEQDHRLFLCNLRNYVCAERTIVDDLAGRPSTTKFLIDIAAVPGQFSEARTQADAFVDAVAAELDPGSGIALATANQVRRQEDAAAIDLPGQGFTPGRFLDEPSSALVLELYFVTGRAGEQFIERLEPLLADVRHAPGVHRVRCLRLAEQCQIGTRPDVAPGP
jgi:hypothetical protein